MKGLIQFIKEEATTANVGSGESPLTIDALNSLITNLHNNATFCEPPVKRIEHNNCNDFFKKISTVYERESTTLFGIPVLFNATVPEGEIHLIGKDGFIIKRVKIIL